MRWSTTIPCATKFCKHFHKLPLLLRTVLPFMPKTFFFFPQMGFLCPVHVNNQIYTKALQTVTLAQPSKSSMGEEQALLRLSLPTKITFLQHLSGELNSYSLLSSLQKSRLPPKAIQFLQTQVKLPSSCMWSFGFWNTKITQDDSHLHRKFAPILNPAQNLPSFKTGLDFQAVQRLQ